jgi:glycosyltransferase involved in cell wall biosynthesis
MKKLLFITPHLSTGGLPQYLTKKIELLNDAYDIYVIEYDDITGGVLVIQKNKIKNLIGDKLITIPFGSDKNILIDKINEIKPDIIHLEEMPEYFMSDDIARKIYTSDRNYKIFETCHDSSFDTNRKRFTPDKFILVSNYQIKMLQPLGINSEVVEYPIDYKERPNREETLLKLGLDPDYKHVLHVGLFTPRKNQKEFFEYANSLKNEKILFHSIGSLADNFRYYWEPLMSNKPDNIVVHGEKSNVDEFYSAMDLFLFTSKGTINDKETMPLVIREAISWKIPTLIYNLPVYENYFDDFKDIQYLDFNDFDLNVNKIKELLDIKTYDKKTAVVITTYCINDVINKITLDCIGAIKKQGYDIILTSHAPIPIELQKEVDHCIYDSNNLLTYHDYYAFYNYSDDNVSVNMDIRTENNHIYHGPAVYTNYYNGISHANNLSYENVICMNYDVILNDDNIISDLKNKLKNKKAIFNHSNAQEGDILRTVLFASKVNFFIDNFKTINNEIEYNEWKNDVGSESNGLENIFYHNLKSKLYDIEILNDEEFYNTLKDCSIDLCSSCEYFNVLPIESDGNSFVVWYSTSNIIDNRNINICVFENEKLLDDTNLNIKDKTIWYKKYDFKTGYDYKIVQYDNYEIKKIINVNDNYMENKLKNNGKIIIK